MIEVHNLTVGYSATEDGQILQGVDFAAKTGKLTALIGTNGAGKSTLLKTIMGILKGKGEISVNGKPVSQYSTKDFSSTVSYLSELTALCIAQHHGAQRWSTSTCVYGASPCKRT